MSHSSKPLPFNKDGFRYNWCEDDEPLCKEYILQLNQLDVSKRITCPTFIKRKVPSSNVKLSECDRAPQLKLNDECTRVIGEKGYSMVRATHGANRGKFYFEVYIESMPDPSATRIGWGQCYANLQAPLGYDYFGYSWRSRFGTKFHQACGKTFDKSGGYGRGDTLGCMIELPYGNDQNHTQAHHLPASVKSTAYVLSQVKKKDTALKRVVRFASLEERDEPPRLAAMKPLVGSKISFYKNGQFVGVAFEDVFEGTYYPTISLYKNCVATVNFGPNFKCPPEKFNSESKNHIDYMPANEMAQISIIDNLLSDLIYILDQEISVDGSNNLQELINKSIQG